MGVPSGAAGASPTLEHPKAAFLGTSFGFGSDSFFLIILLYFYIYIFIFYHDLIKISFNVV